MEKEELEAELAHARQRVESLEHHADALMRNSGAEGTGAGSSADAPALCGVGATFQKSGGGFLVTGLDGGGRGGIPVLGDAHAKPESLGMGDLAIAMDDIPLADMSSVQFRNSIQVSSTPTPQRLRSASPLSPCSSHSPSLARGSERCGA